MAEEIGFENGRNSNFQGLVTLTLTLDPAIRHTVVHHSLTSTYTPNFIQIEETFCGRTDGRTDVRTYGHFSPSLILLGRLLEVDLTRIAVTTVHFFAKAQTSYYPAILHYVARNESILYSTTHSHSLYPNPP